MNWEAIGAIGEIIGAGAVVLTLAYLSIQIRQANNMSKIQGTITSYSLASSWRTNLLQNSDLAEALDKANRDQPLSHKERVQLHTLSEELFVACAVANEASLRSGAFHKLSGEIQYLITVLEANPGLVLQWQQHQALIEIVSASLVKGIDDWLTSKKASLKRKVKKCRNDYFLTNGFAN